MRLKYFNMSAMDPEEIPDVSPLTVFHKYWLSIRPSGGLPSRKHLDPTDIPLIVSWLFLVDVKDNGNSSPDFFYRLIGTSNASLIGKDATGQTVDEAFDRSAARVIINQYKKTIDTRNPTFWRTEVPTEERRFIRCFRGVFPLSGNGQRIDMLAGMLVPVTEIAWV